jgi:tetratricopeptide (TPR) repeat protein
VDLALHGKCSEAMPLLDQTMQDASVRDEDKRSVAIAGVRCSMLLNQELDALSFLAWLQAKNPKDPEILFLAAHAFKDLSERNSQELLNAAPDSPLVVQLNAETFEERGELAKAIAEYRILLKRVPDRPGIHYRVGGLLMSLSASAANSEEARKEFEEELKLNPQNASAEFYIGELARQANDLPKAIQHYRQALVIYPGFAEASYGLGRSLLDSDKTAEAVAPLEAAVKLSPGNPAIHLALGRAYQRLGRKEDASREFAQQKSTSEKMNETTKTLRRNVSGVRADNSQ